MDKIEERMGELEKKQISMNGDIAHIKDRIDNGLGKTITKVFDMLNDFMKSHNEIKAKVSDHTFWIDTIKKAVIFMAITGVMGGALGLAIAIIKKGL